MTDTAAPNEMDITGSVTNSADQPDLTGNMFPVLDECDIDQCVVEGEVPEGLRGSFIRNGPNPAFEPISQYHMFDGDGMLHGITFGDEGVSYRNRWIRSRGLQRENELGHAIYPGLGNVMEFPDRDVTGDAGPVKNPANTHIVRHADRWLALWEGGLPTEVTSELDTVGEFDFDGALRGSMTAHPRLDPRTGEMVFFAYNMFGPPFIHYYVADAKGSVVHYAGIDLPKPVMMHDLVITETHTVFLDSPIVFDMENIGNGPLTRWMPDNGTRIGVMPRMGAAEDITWFEIDNGHVQHFWNGWADGDRIEFNGSRFAHPEFGIGSDDKLDASTSRDHLPMPARYWVDLAAGTAGWEPMDDLCGDFNRINDDYTGVRTDKNYMSGLQTEGRALGDFDTVVKYDTSGSNGPDGVRTEWYSGRHGHVGESVFAPDPNGTNEDDGWLVNAVYYDDRDATDVEILDATDVAAGPIATVKLDRRVPFGFHANWFPA
ncbi:MAG: carotenoid oxygenase family protein [Microthrixaceae bacterium]